MVILSIFSFMAETHPSFAIYRNVTSYSMTSPGPLDTPTNTYTPTPTILNTTESDMNYNKTGYYPTVVILKISHPVLDVIDMVCLSFFTIDFLSRLIVARRLIGYIFSMTGAFDFLALIPDYVQIIAYTIQPELEYSGSVGFIQILRIMRVLRIFRLIRHVPGLWILIYTLKASFKELLLMSAFLIVGMLVFSSLIFFVEDHDTFTSIPHGFWWALITMTTVGYGDMYPKSNWGYLIGSFCALSGLLMIGFSVPVLVNNFIMYYKHVQFAMEEEEIKRKQEVEIRHKENNNGLLEMMSVKTDLPGEAGDAELAPLNACHDHVNNKS